MRSLTRVTQPLYHSWRHRATKVRNFEFPVDILGFSVLSRDRISSLVHLCCYHGAFSLPHKHMRNKTNNVEISNEVTEVCLSEQLAAPVADVKCEHATLKPGCTSRLPLTGWAKTVQWASRAAASHTHTPNIPDKKPTKQTALLAVLTSAATMPLKAQQQLSVVTQMRSVTGTMKAEGECTQKGLRWKARGCSSWLSAS